MEHVYEKIINLDSESQTSGSAGEKPTEQKEEEDMAVMAEEKIELLCQDQVKPSSLLSKVFTGSSKLEKKNVSKSRSDLACQAWIRYRSED